jgi:RNase P subunit RPR2
VSADVCPKCGGLLIEADEIATGWNGALSDVGTGRVVLMCEDCGEVAE